MGANPPERIGCTSETPAIHECVVNLSSWIHDMWFAVGDISFDHELGKATVPLRDKKRDEASSLLVCYGVVGIEIEDTERVGIYDVYTLRLTDSQDELILLGNIPITLHFKLKPEWRIEYTPEGDE